MIRRNNDGKLERTLENWTLEKRKNDQKENWGWNSWWKWYEWYWQRTGKRKHEWWTGKREIGVLWNSFYLMISKKFEINVNHCGILSNGNYIKPEGKTSRKIESVVEGDRGAGYEFRMFKTTNVRNCELNISINKFYDVLFEQCIQTMKRNIE